MQRTAFWRLANKKATQLSGFFIFQDYETIVIQ